MLDFFEKMRQCAAGWLFTICALAFPMAVQAEEVAKPAEPVDFAREIQPLLQSRCVACHGEEKLEGGIRWDERAGALLEGDSGEPAVVPGDHAASETYRRLVSEDEDLRMPPADEAAPLSKAQIALLARWIDEGAVWPEKGLSGAEHWSYVAPQLPKQPVVKQVTWPQGPLDSFVLARLEAEGLQPSPRADRARLLRRVSLDLIGLPPSVEEVDAFLADKSPLAYERAVDRLLTSPRFGEHWARHWLDLARYADSNGYQRDGFRTMWAYRDWVIAAMNRDMPFDQFTIEQLAGDLMPEATVAQKIATGFHRCPTVNVEAGVIQEANRTNQVIDRVNVTGTVWLGTTLACAQCHNHKYDPFSQRDYYRLFAYFNNTPMETRFRGESTSSLEFTDNPSVALEGEGHPLSPELKQEYAALEAEWKQGRIAATEGFDPWVADATAKVAEQADWKVLKEVEFTSTAKAKHELLRDGSILIQAEKDKAASKDVYMVQAETDLRNITGIKLEALSHLSLPEHGPGLQQGDEANFVLSEFSVKARPADDAAGFTQTVELHRPRASFNQTSFHVARAIDGGPLKGWAIAPQFGKSHWATFRTRKPIDFEGGAILKFTLRQSYGEAHTIGRLRLSLLSGESASLEYPEHIAKSLTTPVAERTETQKSALIEFYLSERPALRRMKLEMENMEARISQLDTTSSLIMIEQESPRMTSVFKRGDWNQPGKEVAAGTPVSLHSLPEEAQPNRLGLARWLVDRDNPLVARVTVNRWWAEIFGYGIVTTLEDFGSQGAPPTHPELLDWLAVEFMDNDWSMKHVLKTIVLSATYQQRSAVDADLLTRDPKNILYARGPRLRLAAETIRDNALAISGRLSTKMGGPPIRPPQPEGIWRVTGKVDNSYITSEGKDRDRRGIYVVWRRSSPYPSFVNFDAPDRASCVVRRPRTNTPLMALTLMNDPVYLDLARSLAEQMLRSEPADVRGQIEQGIRRCVARTPRSEEVDLLESIYRKQLARYHDKPSDMAALLGEATVSDEIDRYQLAAMFHVATILLNLDETITKG